MAKLNGFLTKTVRLTGWPLFAAVVTYVVTGFTMSGEYGFGSLMDSDSALAVHKILHLPLLVLFVIHSLPAMYLGVLEMGMDSPVNDHPTGGPADGSPKRGFTRRQAIKIGAAGLAGLAGAGSLAWYLVRARREQLTAEVFKGDAPGEEVWQLWRNRGWAKEAYHYLKLGRNVQCKVCPNNCLLAPGDRSHCRNKVNRDGRLYTLAYANPCALHVDPVEKKPLYHFLPGTATFSLATAGCVFRCLNCQNWEISQKKPEETKNARGPELRLRPTGAGLVPPTLTLADVERLSLFPEDLVALAGELGCPSISYTYSEPTAYYEYTYDSARLARAAKVRNILVTCGSIEQRALEDLAQYLDAAHVDLKGFDEQTYRTLNTGRLKPILGTLKTLRRLGVWFEVINLIVPTYTDRLDRIQRMCAWLADNLGPDTVLHFSRFSPAHKLTHLWPTPTDILLQARQAARSAGLRYVYVGNVPGLVDAGTTFCPNCKRAVFERDIFAVTARNLSAGRCKFCQTPIAGVWA